MASNYRAILKENLRRYGTDIGRIGQELLANRYLITTQAKRNLSSRSGIGGVLSAT